MPYPLWEIVVSVKRSFFPIQGSEQQFTIIVYNPTASPTHTGSEFGPSCRKEQEQTPKYYGKSFHTQVSVSKMK